uniref:Nose resistant-to-fluoxetine protein N-terminal domain-containing protein n=1 Tax=Panagrolaimus sp. JU765 TaxID=591449 RepID=A0AC34RDJ1_9BILA
MEDMILIAAANNLTSSYVPAGFDQTLKLMMDAQGKQPPGVLRGAIKWYGSKQECDLVYFKIPNRKRPFETSYSRLFFDLAVLSGGNKTCDAKTGYALGFDACLPNSCNRNDIFKIAEFVFETGNMTDGLCSVTTMEDIKVDYDYRSYIVMTIIGIILVIVSASSILDYLILPEKSPLRSEPGLILFLAFSFPRNVAEIMSGGKSGQKGQIGPIHFIRFISITWVIVCHCIMSFLSNINNYMDMMSIIDYPMTQIIINGFFSVDNFFFIGAVLVSFLFFKELERNRKMVMSVKGWIMFYLHRYLRLSPSYFMAIAFSVWVYTPWASQRVIHLTQTPVDNQCNQHFWKYVLYINNLRMEDISVSI